MPELFRNRDLQRLLAGTTDLAIESPLNNLPYELTLHYGLTLCLNRPPLLSALPHQLIPEPLYVVPVRLRLLPLIRRGLLAHSLEPGALSGLLVAPKLLLQGCLGCREVASGERVVSVGLFLVMEATLHALFA